MTQSYRDFPKRKVSQLPQYKRIVLWLFAFFGKTSFIHPANGGGKTKRTTDIKTVLTITANMFTYLLNIMRYYGDGMEPTLSKKLHWKARFDFVDMCRDAWRWRNNNPNGFK